MKYVIVEVNRTDRQIKAYKFVGNVEDLIKDLLLLWKKSPDHPLWCILVDEEVFKKKIVSRLLRNREELMEDLLAYFYSPGYAPKLEEIFNFEPNDFWVETETSRLYAGTGTEEVWVHFRRQQTCIRIQAYIDIETTEVIRAVASKACFLWDVPEKRMKIPIELLKMSVEKFIDYVSKLIQRG
jgi:hypothetical protein